MANETNVTPTGSEGTVRSSPTTAEIYARGDVTTRVVVVAGVLIIVVILVLGGLFISYTQPDRTKDVWVIIGPLISAALSGTIGFIAGESHKKRER